MLPTNESKIIDVLLDKFVKEEIMTKSELDRRLDAVMEKHEAHLDARFQQVDARFQSLESRIDNQFLKIDHRYNWIIGLIITSAIGLGGVMIKILSMLPGH